MAIIQQHSYLAGRESLKVISLKVSKETNQISDILVPCSDKIELLTRSGLPFKEKNDSRFKNKKQSEILSVTWYLKRNILSRKSKVVVFGLAYDNEEAVKVQNPCLIC